MSINTSHPTTFYGADFLSADFPGAARGYLREALGEKIAVLFLNGAQGDISIEDQVTKHGSSRSAETLLTRTAHQVAGETLRLYTEMTFRETVTVAAAESALELSIRLPDDERVRWARKTLGAADAGGGGGSMDRILAFGITTLQEEYGSAGVQQVPIQAIRVGDVGFCAVPFELYCQFGLDIKRRSPSPMTAVVGLANGSEGYVPTPYAPLGGGYSGEPIRWTRFTHDAGFRIVDAGADLLYRLWEFDVEPGAGTTARR